MTQSSFDWLLTKRQVLKLGAFGGTALALPARFQRPRLPSNAVVVPGSYFESAPYRLWMQLSYNQGFESRAVRRRVGTILANSGSMRGRGNGAAFAALFQDAVLQFFRMRPPRPPSIFALLQHIYDQVLTQHPREIRQVMFWILLSILRGQDGTRQGETAHRVYQLYRTATLRYKDAYLTARNAGQVRRARTIRNVLLRLWQTLLQRQVEAYALGRRTLRPDFRITPEMLAGFEITVPPGR